MTMYSSTKYNKSFEIEERKRENTKVTEKRNSGESCATCSHNRTEKHIARCKLKAKIIQPYNICHLHLRRI